MSAEQPVSGIRVPVWPVTLGIPAGLLATFDPGGGGVWWVISHTARFVWSWPFIPPVVYSLAGLAVLAGVAVGGYQAWRKWT